MNECYECKYKGNVPGSCHSSCEYPLAKESGFASAMVILRMGWVHVGEGGNGILVKGATHGIKNGWFNWPMDFDPCWLERCTGFCE